MPYMNEDTTILQWVRRGSTYGTFFTNREVKTVAEYIGLKGRNYRIIDLSEDLEEFQYSGKLGKHYVNRDGRTPISNFLRQE